MMTKVEKEMLMWLGLVKKMIDGTDFKDESEREKGYDKLTNLNWGRSKDKVKRILNRWTYKKALMRVHEAKDICQNHSKWNAVICWEKGVICIYMCNSLLCVNNNTNE